MPLIRETIVSTIAADGSAHLAPLGVIVEGEERILAPFHPSTTLDNLRQRPVACVNYVTDVRIFAGCITRRRRDWPVVPAERVPAARLRAALAHEELELVALEEDPLRPRFRFRVVHTGWHAPFDGFNRARHAVIEACILLSRRHLIAAEEIAQALTRLAPLIDKTAGPAEREAWTWITEALSTPPSKAA
jgi:hypothetical protein